MTATFLIGAMLGGATLAAICRASRDPAPQKAK
jgi:hypothetical protein